MKLKKSIVTFLIAGLVTMGMPSTYQAASFNHMNKVLTVMPNEVLDENQASILSIRLIDELEENAIFYLDLTGAKWLDANFDSTLKGADPSCSLEIKCLSQKRLQVKVKGGSLSEGTTLRIPMQIQMTDAKAQVSIKGNNTTVSSGTYLIAETASYKGSLTTGELPVTTTDGVMANIKLEEPFSRAFTKAMMQGVSPTIQLRLNHNDYAFSLLDSNAVLIGSQGFEGINGDDAAIKQIDAQTLEITLPDISSAKYTGCFTLSGVRIKRVDKLAVQEVLTVTALGGLIDQTTIDVLKVMDYAITLESQLQTVRAGTKQEVVFVLEEQIEDSLVRNRPTTFVFNKGVEIETTKEDKVSVRINGEEVLCESIEDEQGKAVGFKVAKLPADEVRYTIEVPTYVAVGQTGTVTLTAEGRSLLENLQVPVLNIYAPFKISVQPFKTVIGLKDQVGGEIVLEETRPGEFIQGEKIILDLEKSAIKYSMLPQIEVVKGDLRLGEAKINGNHIEIPIVRRSNAASTIVISNFNVTVDQTVAEGSYILKIGGSALSTFADESNIVPFWQGAFISVSERSAEEVEVVPSQTMVTVCFTLGNPYYTLGDELKEMEAAPYSSNGRTMLPIRYVADALGISAEFVVWNAQAKTITIYAEDIIVLELGSKIMKINGQTIEMSAMPEVVNGRTFIPVAELTRSLGIITTWHNEKKQVSFITNIK
ncbi:MAG: hypothetical protein E7231_10750 [Cellulosilyticum sp.]|nr:hypothetical protein [Cellulosilyticum sp.]